MLSDDRMLLLDIKRYGWVGFASIALGVGVWKGCAEHLSIVLVARILSWLFFAVFMVSFHFEHHLMN